MPNIILILVLGVAFVAFVLPLPAYAGIASHKHEKHNSKERLKDGIYAPRDAHHHGDDGEHNVEFDHEAIIGNVKEAQEYDTLTPEESKKRLMVLVKMMDVNKDGYVDRHELKVWILRSFIKLSAEEASDRFEEIDTDTNGIITWREYLQDVYGMEDENYKKEVIDFDSYDEEHQMIMNDKEMFNAADQNKDGDLDFDEYRAFHTPEEHASMMPILLAHTMRDKDLDNDGQIDFHEFVGDSDHPPSKEWLITEKERFDNEYDVNHDGVLIGQEVLAWVVPSNEDVAKDEVDHLFASTDEDHDDRLSYAEIINNYETFVGSEATDYGDHLQNIHHLTDEL